MLRFRNGLLLGTSMSSAGEPPAGGGGAAPPGDSAQQLADVRAEAAARRVELRDTTERLTTVTGEFEQYRSSEPQRVEAATAPLRATQEKLTAKAISAELKASAVAEGLVDPDLLPLIDKTGVSYDPATDTFTGIKEAVDKFKTSKPSYFVARSSQQAPPRQQTGSGREPSTPGPTERPDVKALPKKDYETAKKDALRALR